MKISRLAVFLLFFSWFTFAPTTLQTAPPDNSPIDSSILRKIDPYLLKEIRAEKGGRASYIVQFVGKPDLTAASRESDKQARRRATVWALQALADRVQKPALDSLEIRRRNGEVEAYSSLWIINGVVVKGNLQSVLDLAARSDVQSIKADRRRYLVLPDDPIDRATTPSDANQISPSGIEWNIAKIRADAAWSALGIDGTGTVVAIVDTGVDWQHPALVGKYRGYEGKGLPNHSGSWSDFTPEGFQYPSDTYGHGTHVAGIIVGSDTNNTVGVAPGAKWIAARVFAGSSNPYADDSWIHNAFQWLLAPAGNPDLAPDVINASWGSPDSADGTFGPDIEALLAAGITPVFAAGNDGPALYTINSPASLDAAFSVGATDSADNLAYFSSRGPSPWGKVKPEVSAPGVYVRSAYPGGSYASMSGTSMAAPHVAGLVALLKQASPAMLPIEAIGAITTTSIPRGTDRPNNQFGWGRVDAYGAVSQVLQAGSLSGSVSSAAGATIAGAIVTATNQTTGAYSLATTRSDGTYSMALAAGFYDVNAVAFGFGESDTSRAAIEVRGMATQNLTLSPLPSGYVAGVVTEAGTGLPLSATVTVHGTPLSVPTLPGSGFFTFTVPVGTYDLTAMSEKHRIHTETGVAVSLEATTYVTLTLTAAPAILLVDSGAWYGESRIGYYSAALDQLDYLYTVRPITDTSLVPTAFEMAPYDVVIWSSPLDSPGYVGASAALDAYLAGGGRLFLSGQDIGYYDSGSSSFVYAPYYQDRLNARFVSDDSGIADLVGGAEGMFAGITLTLNTPDSARNQAYPDIIAPEGFRASSVINYSGDGSAGIETDVCLPYRAVYLGFGLEGAGPAASRTELMGRTIDWLMALPASGEVRVLPGSQSKIEEPGKTATASITVWNTGAQPSSFAISASGGTWPVSVWDSSFINPISTTGDIASCESISVGVKMEVPGEAGKGIANSVAISLTSISDPAVHDVATVTVKTPAFILLVDDDRWYDVESDYKNALSGAGYAYDVFDTHGSAGPAIATLDKYSITVWFTGYDWYQPLSAQEEADLSTYLDRGGRLFLSSQDYLYVRGLNGFGTNYLGVGDYINDVTATLVNGASGEMIGDGIGPYTLTLPYDGYREWSDEVFPAPNASVSFLNMYDNPTGIATLDGTSRIRTVFFAFPFEGLDAEPARQVMDRVIGRALATDVRVSTDWVRTGQELRYEISVFNPGIAAANWAITSPVPISTTIVGGSLEGGVTYDDANEQVLFAGAIAPGEARQFAYRVQVSQSAQGQIIAVTHFENAGKGIFERIVTTKVAPYSVYLPAIVANSTGGQ